jgi:hypothetical protein
MELTKFVLKANRTPLDRRISYDQAREINAERSPRAIKEDRSIEAQLQYPRGLVDYSAWANEPSHSDIGKITEVRKLGYEQIVLNLHREHMDGKLVL